MKPLEPVNNNFKEQMQGAFWAMITLACAQFFFTLVLETLAIKLYCTQ